MERQIASVTIISSKFMSTLSSLSEKKTRGAIVRCQFYLSSLGILFLKIKDRMWIQTCKFQVATKKPWMFLYGIYQRDRTILPIMPGIKRLHASLGRAWRFRWTAFSSLLGKLIWRRCKGHCEIVKYWTKLQILLSKHVNNFQPEKDVLQISRNSTSVVGATVLLEEHRLCFRFNLASSTLSACWRILNCASMTFCSSCHML
jgi:hypothetical protein